MSLRPLHDELVVKRLKIATGHLLAGPAAHPAPPSEVGAVGSDGRGLTGKLVGHLVIASASATKAAEVDGLATASDAIDQ